MAHRSRGPPRGGGGRSGGGGFGSRGGGGGFGDFGGMKKSGQPGSNIRLPRWDMTRLTPFVKDFYQESPITSGRSQGEVDKFRAEWELAIEGSFLPRPIQTFDELVVPEFAKIPIYKNGFTAPTAIQAQGWPVALKGKNMVGIAQTGSGKTYSFILPAVLNIKNQPPLQPNETGPIALVLCPTRELSQQVAQVAEEFSQCAQIRVACIYGGSPKQPQLQAIENGCELIIATPGRLLDFMEARKLYLDRVTYLVLDEADRMLDMGFEPQIRTIIKCCRPDRQTLMWSATWPKEVHALAYEFLTDYTKINVGSQEIHANHNILQVVDVCEEFEKEGKLIRLLEEIMRQPENKTIIFTETKLKADQLTTAMRRDGWPSLCIHGDKKQTEREWVLEDFRSGRTPILVATDVAARGLDISDVKYVINFDYPTSSEDYVHRIGRTGRVSNTGTAYTFFVPKNFHKATDLIKVLEEAHQTVPPKLRNLHGYSKPDRSRFRDKDRDRGSSSRGPSSISRSSTSRGPPPPPPPRRDDRRPPPPSGRSGGPPPLGRPGGHAMPPRHPPPGAGASGGYGHAPPPPRQYDYDYGAPPASHYGAPPPPGPPPASSYYSRAPPPAHPAYYQPY